MATTTAHYLVRALPLFLSLVEGTQLAGRKKSEYGIRHCVLCWEPREWDYTRTRYTRGHEHMGGWDTKMSMPWVTRVLAKEIKRTHTSKASDTPDWADVQMLLLDYGKRR
jgi:hypothetical protein